MNRFASVMLLGSSVLAFSLAANAQTRGQGQYYPQRDDPYYRNDPNRGGYGDDSYSRQGDSYPGWRGYGDDGHGGNQGSLVRRVMSDLNRAVSNARLVQHERKHFDEAAIRLQDFQERWAQGRFDSGKLDKAIQNLEHLANADRVRGRDRAMLARDVQDLRQLRATAGRYSNYGNGDYRDDRYNQNRRYDPNWPRR